MCLSASIYKLAIAILATDAFPILAKTRYRYQNVQYPDMKNISALHFCQYAFSCATLQNLSQMATNAKPIWNPEKASIFLVFFAPENLSFLLLFCQLWHIIFINKNTSARFTDRKTLLGITF